MDTKKALITVQAIVDAPIEMVWEKWTNPDSITEWNTASDNWHTTKAKNDLRIGGKFLSRMEAKDGTVGFDFIGVYDNVKTNELIEYTLEDDRKVKVSFTPENGKTKIIETFEAESENSLELQFGGWQAILDNFKKYTEDSF
ncbi:MAG: SRPBCC family protein [Bacteroidota bacterium]